MSTRGTYPPYPPVTPPNHTISSFSPSLSTASYPFMSSTPIFPDSCSTPLYLPSTSSYPSLSSTPIFPDSSSTPLYLPSTPDKSFIHTIYAPDPNRSPPPSHAHPSVPQLLPSFSNSAYSPPYVPPVPPYTPPYVPLPTRRSSNVWAPGGFDPIPMRRLQPMWMDLSVGALTSMPGVQRDGDGLGEIREKALARDVMQKDQEDGNGIGVGNTGAHMSRREAWRCKNHWNGVFCPKWVLSDGAACGDRMSHGYY